MKRKLSLATFISHKKWIYFVWMFFIPAVFISTQLFGQSHTLNFLNGADVSSNPQFANGADIGWLSEMESKGYKFYNDAGIEKNCLEILQEQGINSLRFRVWVNPRNGWCGKKDVVYMAQRADNMGFRVMLDFHLSDTWADPGNQTKPAAWVGHSVPELLTDVYNHVYDVLDTLKTIGVIPTWVQIGNETNDGTLWEDGRASTHMKNFADIINSGYDAAKAIDSTIQVIVQLSNGHDKSMYRWMFDGLKNNGAKWDIIGLSVYPYWANLPWATENEKSLDTMQDMITRYQTQVMVCETGYLYNDPTNAYNFLIDLIRKTKSVGGLSVFYWEPECYNWRNYKLGAWDPVTKKPTIAMDAFLDTLNTAVPCEQNVPTSFALSIYPNPFNPGTTIEYQLPISSDVSVVIYDMLGREVIRLADGFQVAGQHSVVWSATTMPSGIYFCRIQADHYTDIKKCMLTK
jgi:arabinogalactan endo-1,4-beta-galactosidase